jgi:hypothetical protein
VSNDKTLSAIILSAIINEREYLVCLKKTGWSHRSKESHKDRDVFTVFSDEASRDNFMIQEQFEERSLLRYGLDAWKIAL